MKNNTTNILNSLPKDGRFFTVTFDKLDGSKRKMNCRLGVKKYVKGNSGPIGNSSLGPAKTRKPNHNIITVFEIPTKKYKCIRINSIHELRVNGKVICFT